VGSITNFSHVRKVLESMDEVKSVNPMGINFAVVTPGNILDRKLGQLRKAHSAGHKTRAKVLLAHIKRIVGVLAQELKNMAAVADIKEVEKQAGEKLDAIERTKEPSFWDGYSRSPLDFLEFMENKVAPLALDQDLLWVAYIGADTARFEQTFDRFEIVDGERVPPGQRGFLFNKRFYEERVKNKLAHRLDKIKKRLDQGDTIAECEDCQNWIKMNGKQAANLIFQLDDEAGAKVRAALQDHLSQKETDLLTLLRSFLEVKDSNFAERHAFFYTAIAPHLALYMINVGDTLVLSGYGKGGYSRKVPVKVYGTYRFRSLDESPMAGGFNMLDLMTFRDLYGYMTNERLKEIEQIRASVGSIDIKRDEAEEALFGDNAQLVDESTVAAAFDETAGVDLKTGGNSFSQEIAARVYSTAEIEDGVVPNAAIMLVEGVTIERGKAAIEKKIAAANLGLNVVSWRDASGMVGDLITVIRVVLYVAVFIIFIVAIVIINNSLVMSTLERTREIGTMRAIGAQRSFIMQMFLVETGVLSLIFGGLGAALGAGLMFILETTGIPAWDRITVFLFAGPRLYPSLMVHHLVIAMGVIVTVGLASTLYPARLATRIAPIVAMQDDD
jgi:hypothetical protein